MLPFPFNRQLGCPSLQQVPDFTHPLWPPSGQSPLEKKRRVHSHTIEGAKPLDASRKDWTPLDNFSIRKCLRRQSGMVQATENGPLWGVQILSFRSSDTKLNKHTRHRQTPTNWQPKGEDDATPCKQMQGGVKIRYR
jgi:hypothetical protein